MRGLLSRQLLWAIAISVALHFLLVFSADILLPDGSQSGDLIEITLAPLPPKQAPPEPAAKPKPAEPQPLAKKPAKPKPVSKPVEPPPREEAPAASAVVAPAALAEAPAVPEAPPPEQPPEPAPAPIPDEPVAVPPAPKKVDIDFQLTRGKSDTAVGRVRQTFRLEDGNRYTLHSVAEASGVVSLFVSGKFEEHSEGLVTEQGLRPLSFRQLRGKKEQAARFDWEAHTVALEAGERKSSAEIVDGTQDMLSFLYQFMFVPPLEQMRVTLANGRKLKTYVYSFEGEQKLETRMGPLRTIHIAKSSGDADEKLEAWLAEDYRYLPVKIRQTDKDGTVTEQLAVRLQIE